MNELTAATLSLALVIAFGLPIAFLFGREMGREDERTELPELRPNAEVRFRPQDGWVTRYAVRSVTQSLNEPTVVVLQDLVSARMVKQRQEPAWLVPEDVEFPVDLTEEQRNYGGRA